MAAKPHRKNYFKNSASKKSELRNRRWVQVLRAAVLLSVVALMSLGFILCHDLLMQSAFFNVGDIIVTGEIRLTADDVIRQARVHKGINLLSLNLTKTRKRILTHPWIEEADITRKLPDQIHIHIKEQQPLAILDLGRKFIINPAGVIFKEWGPADPHNLPMVTGLQFSDISVPGTSRSTAFEAVMTVLALGRQDGSVLPNRVIEGIRVDREIGLTLLAFGRQKQIKLGYDDYFGKYENLKDILFHIGTGTEFPDFETIDLNDLNRVVVHPIKSPQRA